MAIKEQSEETASKSALEKVLKSTINEMHKLNVPDAEIVHNIKRLMDNLYDEKSTMRRYKDSVFRKLFDDKNELLSLYYDTYGLFRTSYFHKPTKYSHIVELASHFYAHILAGPKVFCPHMSKLMCVKTF